MPPPPPPFPLNYSEYMEEELSALVTCLKHNPPTITHLHIELRNEDNGEVLDPINTALVLALTSLGPICGPLTHIKVFGVVECMTDSNLYDRFLQAASTVCPSSLTHLEFFLQLLIPKAMVPEGWGVQVQGPGHHFIMDTDTAAWLSSFTSLTHLVLRCATLLNEPVWDALPPSLQHLKVHDTHCLSDASLRNLPNLHTLLLKESGCSSLRQLLQAAPNLQQLSLRELRVPTSVQEQSYLTYIMNHPLWKQNGGGGPQCTPVTWLSQRMEREMDEGLSPAEVLATLPTMPTITWFKFDFAYDPEGVGLLVGPARLLHHITRAFPHVLYLDLEHLPALDSDLTQLYTCTSLEQLQFKSCDAVTGEAVLLLVAALPSLYSIRLDANELISDAHRQAIKELTESRKTALWKARKTAEKESRST